jgi:hypothetical protein
MSMLASDLASTLWCGGDRPDLRARIRAKLEAAVDGRALPADEAVTPARAELLRALEGALGVDEGGLA